MNLYEMITWLLTHPYLWSSNQINQTQHTAKIKQDV